MQSRIFRTILLTAIVLALAGCASPGAKLTGAWTLLDDNGRPTDMTKILTGDHFAFGTQLDTGAIWAGGGTWKLEDGNYFETVEYHSAPAVVGKTIRFDCRLVDNLWYHEGSFRAGNETFRVVEVWKRIEPKD